MDNKLRNLLAFLSHQDKSLFRGHEGRYVVVSSGEVWPSSFAIIDDVFNEEGISVDHMTTHIYMVPPLAPH
jgi:hypothetical protein